LRIHGCRCDSVSRVSLPESVTAQRGEIRNANERQALRKARFTVVSSTLSSVPLLLRRATHLGYPGPTVRKYRVPVGKELQGSGSHLKQNQQIPQNTYPRLPG